MGILHPIYHTDAHGLPLGAEVNLEEYKTIFIDIGLTQSSLGLDLKAWFLNPQQAFVNQGAIVEAFIGQEMLAYAHSFQKQALYYWQKESRSSQAEVDYVMQFNNDIVPVEVKSGTTGHLKSLREFLNAHLNSSYSIRFSTHNYSCYENLHSYPLYAVVKIYNQGARST